MEIRRHVHGDGRLWTLTCIARDDGFRVASVIIVGKDEVVVVDTQWTLSNAHRVVAEIFSLNKRLKAIFCTHAHPDHYFGTQVFTDAFPGVPVYALEEDIPVIADQFLPKLDHWKAQIGDVNCADRPIEFTPYRDGCLDLDGSKIEVMPKVWGDLKYNSVVWVPSIKTVICSDVVFNGAHPFTCEVTRKGRKGWIQDLERIRGLGAEVIIPGHAKRDMPFDESGLDYTREYLIATDEELDAISARQGRGGVFEFYYNMDKRFFDSKLKMSNEMNANVFLGGREWNDLWNEDMDEDADAEG
ncbi:MAG: MBL fold metallo-hydrolase [Clostridiales Family XIII bacterium]|jgi:glyoxylase-like metal-dependent hydrolase (beta-lactamase superfamily II)|nr:MBL fold metallo-hydrolase [Clostridiales Family XIII bacterium]